VVIPANGQTALLSTGAARARPEPGLGPCWSLFTAAEAQAREAGRGLWPEPVRGLLDAARPETVAAANGRYAVVTGRIFRIGEGRRHVFLNLAGPSWPHVSVLIDRRLARRWQGEGLDVRGLKGQTVVIRTVASVARGPVLRVTAREEIEITE
jgi:hypothetical protein